MQKVGHDLHMSAATGVAEGGWGKWCGKAFKGIMIRFMKRFYAPANTPALMPRDLVVNFSAS